MTCLPCFLTGSQKHGQKPGRHLKKLIAHPTNKNVCAIVLLPKRKPQKHQEASRSPPNWPKRAAQRHHVTGNNNAATVAVLSRKSPTECYSCTLVAKTCYRKQRRPQGCIFNRKTKFGSPFNNVFLALMPQHLALRINMIGCKHGQEMPCTREATCLNFTHNQWHLELIILHPSAGHNHEMTAHHMSAHHMTSRQATWATSRPVTQKNHYDTEHHAAASDENIDSRSDPDKPARDSAPEKRAG